MDQKFPMPEPRTGNCRNLCAVLLNPEECGALARIMALRNMNEADAVGLALRLSLPMVEAIANATTLTALPFNDQAVRAARGDV